MLTEKIERPTDNTKIKISDFGLSKIIKQFDSGRIQMTGQLGTCVNKKNNSLALDGTRSNRK